MPSEQELRQLQETELEALRAIFLDDFVQIRNRSATKTLATPFEFRLKIHTNEVELQDLVSFSLRASTLVSQQLQQKLNTKANELIGSEMLYELAMLASEFITEKNNVVPIANRGSLIEERLTRSLEAEKQHRLALEAENEKQLALKSHQDLEFARQIQQDIDARRNLLRREREKACSSTSFHDKTSGSTAEGLLSLPPGSLYEVNSSKGLLKAQIGFEIPHILPMASVYDARISEIGPIFLVLVQPRGRYYHTTQGKKMLHKVSSELIRLCDLVHPNLQTIYGSDLSDTKLSIVSEPLPTISMHEFLNQCGSLRVEKALECLKQILSGLTALHQAHLVHRAIKPRNIFIHFSPDQPDKSTYKLGNVSWFQRLWDICKSNPFSDLPSEPPIPDSWLQPTTLQDPLAYDRDRDLFDLGVTFAQILFGELWPRWKSPADCLDNFPTDCPSICQQLLESLLFNYKKTSARQLIDRLAKFETSLENPAATHDLSQLPHLKSTKNSGSQNPAFPQGVFWQPQGTLYSRYRNDFDEVEFLGKGGFGEVVKARNKLDSRFYAVKKISLPADPRKESKILREVTILSRMSHPHIVRYHACWIETIPTLPASSHSDISQTSCGENYFPSLKEGPSNNGGSGASDNNGSDDAEDNTTIHDFDFELGLDDLDFLSCHHDCSMPSIRFGDPSRSRSVCIDSPLVTADKQIGCSSHSDHKETAGSEITLRRTLFMQMEFVDSLTLREAIDHGLESERDIWRISRQILSAMAYFTSLNVIHRDLKPSNIFLDAKGDVRLGDFGLAINQNFIEAEPASQVLSIPSDITTGVGTALYIPPETLEGRHIPVRCLEKIDMYSFGIVLFEMFHKMSTVHERIHIIKDLRKADIKFPSDWRDEPNGIKTRIIKWCLNHTAEMRPSPTELFKSNLFPPQPEHENIEEITRLISRPDHAMFRPYLASLFDQPLLDRIRRDFTYDFHTADTSQKVLENPFRTFICDQLTEKFRLRGAVNFESPVLVPYTDIDHPFLVKLLDCEGTVVTLHFDTAVPFARTVARDESLIRLKRFSFSPIYRPNPAGGQPITIPVASYDIVSPIRTLAAESEVLQLADDLIYSLPLGRSSFQHILSHNKLWEAMFFGIPVHQRGLLQQALEKYNTKNSPEWCELSRELAEKIRISKPIFDAIQRTFDIFGDIDVITAHLRSSLPLLYETNLKDAIGELEVVIKSARSLGMQGSIAIWPMLAPQHRSNSNGVFFNTCDTHKGKVLAAGGRFDGLVQKLSAPGGSHSQTKRHLVSVSLPVARLSLAVAQNTQISSTTSWTPRRCDVYVMSFSAGLLQDRMMVIKELWAGGISADLMYEIDNQFTSSEAMLQSCRQEGILFAVIVKASNPYKDPTLKVKSLNQKTEFEVPIRELTTWLQDALHEHQRSEGGNTNFKSFHEQHLRTSQKGRLSGSNQITTIEQALPGRDCLLLLPSDVSRKTKHKGRQAVYDRAFEVIGNTIKSLSQIPIFVLDLEESTFHQLCRNSLWIESEDTYRKNIVDSTPTSRKPYLWEIRESILNYLSKDQTTKFLWLFNLKTNKCDWLKVS
ncbi:hypothetical protein O181_008909 [Austropuccinia psidii MF-1]|uniref:non-specific serine/threonine protein kinase n=1 Tax=Austropuccinia psidii MF-1 TaxID=1389203 RepID=A0A9Q3GJB4_9BASI|nr:hypothetical protein [Austropuccinia psidii MF-1]